MRIGDSRTRRAGSPRAAPCCPLGRRFVPSAPSPLPAEHPSRHLVIHKARKMGARSPWWLDVDGARGFRVGRFRGDLFHHPVLLSQRPSARINEEPNLIWVCSLRNSSHPVLMRPVIPRRRAGFDRGRLIWRMASSRRYPRSGSQNNLPRAPERHARAGYPMQVRQRARSPLMQQKGFLP
jgi:hypothetical protein